MIQNRLMFWFWRMGERTGFKPFEWIGNFIEDWCNPVFSPEVIRRVEEHRAGNYEPVFEGSFDEFKKWMEELLAAMQCRNCACDLETPDGDPYGEYPQTDGLCLDCWEKYPAARREVC